MGPDESVLEPTSTPVEMGSSDGQGGEGDKPLEKVKWGWRCEGGRKGGSLMGWFWKAKNMKRKEEEKKDNW